MTRSARQRHGGNPSPVYTAPAVASLVAHWSGNVATPSEAPNRVGGPVGAMVQPTLSRQPSIVTLTGGVKALQFGSGTRDMFTPDVAALRTSPKGFWAWHLRSTNNGSGRLFSQWGPSERLEINYIFNTRLEVRVAASPVTLSQRNFTVANLGNVMTAGVWLTLAIDCTLSDATLRIMPSIGGVPMTLNGTGGVGPPGALEAGDATLVYLASLNGGSNLSVDVAHHYICNDMPSGAEISAMQAWEPPNWS